MLQLLQSFKTGKTDLLEVPCPALKPGHLLIKTHYSVISSGTERMLVSFGQSNLLQKARAQPEKVRQVIDKIKTDGLMSTLESVKSKLDTSIPMGYSNVGEVIAVGNRVQDIEVGDFVISNGSHAEVVSVPRLLTAKCPEGVSLEEAAFSVIASIALQGIRLAAPTLGEKVVVMGLGLVGLMTVQLLRAQGCAVLAADMIPERLALAAKCGAETVNLSIEDIVEQGDAFSNQAGVDAVLICASTTSNDPIDQAATICRKRGRIVCVGVVGLSLSRQQFYEKELTFQVSCSYGPGRYDPEYEQEGKDYPLPYVRWTEQRNFEAVLQLLKSGALDFSSLITHRFPFSEAEKAYEALMTEKAVLGILLCYDTSYQENERKKMSSIAYDTREPLEERPRLAVIGVGNYAKRFLIPAVQKTTAYIKMVTSISGVTAGQTAKIFNISEANSDFQRALGHSDIDGLVIATRHHQHAKMVIAGLNAGKSVFVEKPLAIHQDEIAEIEDTVHRLLSAGKMPHVMVGFNRRFSRLFLKAKILLSQTSSPKNIDIQINAGHLPSSHWTQDIQVGGGRLIGEACHFIDLVRDLNGPIIHADITGMKDPEGSNDTFSILLKSQDGSIATIRYFANGHRKISKETIKIFVSGRSIIIDNFRRLTQYGFKGKRELKLLRQDKGQFACMQAYVDSLEYGKPSPIPFNEIIEVSTLTIQLQEKLVSSIK